MPYRGFMQEEASVRQRRLAALLSLLVLASIGLAVPHAARPLPALPHISGMYGAATAMIDLATFWLLISAPTPHRSHIIIAAAYLFGCLMAIAYVVTFPGAVFVGETVLGSAHAVSWLFTGWRAGFALLACWATLAEAPIGTEANRSRAALPLLAAVLLTSLIIAICQFTDVGTVKEDGSRLAFGRVSVIGSYVGVLFTLVAVVTIVYRGLFRRSIYAWLVFVLIAEGSGVWLSTFGGHRYSLAWYMARLEGLVANSVLLGVVAIHFRSVQKRLTDAYIALEQRTDQLQAQMQKREAAESQLAQAQKLDVVGRLGASLAHDLNNILQVLTGRLAIVQRRAGGDVEADVQVMKKSVRKAHALTRQLTLLSGRRRNTPIPVALEPVIREMEQDLVSLLRTGCQLRLEVTNGLVCVLVDPIELEIAITNLVTNASHAMKVAGEICLRAYPATLNGQAAAAVAVSDQGEGIRPEILPRVFEPFFTTKSRGEGTGLGLPQVQAFVTASGGTIDVSSEVGRGTTVTMTFPHANPGVEVAPASVHVRRALEGRVVLLVEDNDDVRESTEQLLSAEGLAVHAVPAAKHALDMLANGFVPDWLLSDIVMPGGMDGLELVRVVRRRYPRIRTVLATGYSDVAERAREEGFPVMRKPYDWSSLCEVLTEGGSSGAQAKNR